MEIRKLDSNTSIQHFDTINADIQDHIDRQQDFVAFILIALGIEFLGSFYDAKDFNDFGQSSNRFKAGLRVFKNEWYTKNQDFVFVSFRGPLIHQYRAGDEIFLTSFCKQKVDVNKHLLTDEGKSIFVLEKLFDDYKEAVLVFKGQLERQHSLNKNKINQQYAATNTVTISEKETGSKTTIVVSGTPETQIVHIENEYQSSSKSKKKKK